MNVMFITIENYDSFNKRSIYLDLVNEFVRHGHYVTVLSACEARDKRENTSEYYGIKGKGEIIKVFVPNVTKLSDFVLKGINLLRTIPIFDHCAKKAMKSRKYDLVVYGSPPISVFKAVERVKKTHGASTYLLLKDIWPYDCLFGGVLTLHGWKRIAFDFLSLLARKLYDTSDIIGCMSPANVKFLLENESRVDKEKVTICPNCSTPFKVCLSNDDKAAIRRKYRIPTDKTVFIYGGSIGIPQGIDFAVKSVEASKSNQDAYFLFVGNGTEQKKVAEIESFGNATFLPAMNKDEYETLVFACDVGLIYLDHSCLAPNYPSRLLAYMQAALPILCATDTYTDVGSIAVENGYGLWCESNNPKRFSDLVSELCVEDFRMNMGKRSYDYYFSHYTSEVVYKKIMHDIGVIV